ncbi:hypothetical protein JN11_00444 [Mucilaginibacter frigoritolerans]|uniref:Uncharacterized protein n=1 Tax=Mucilaginibacter frigoritolerans TaxID=652788 RepID=A0A562UG36_9SPHI|nr:hypothetical protein [Mucilaginibacter frigoritolerans]TWJ04723.1 hypothetical protein JN11_00444 [Mucilaginibacter frigoritolerans]
MKKTKIVKLVLLTCLTGNGYASFGHPLNINTRKNFSNSTIRRNGYYFADDTVQHHSGSSFIPHSSVSRGGWGSSGHTHSSSS